MSTNNRMILYTIYVLNIISYNNYFQKELGKKIHHVWDVLVK